MSKYQKAEPNGNRCLLSTSQLEASAHHVRMPEHEPHVKTAALLRLTGQSEEGASGAI